MTHYLRTDINMYMAKQVYAIILEGPKPTLLKTKRVWSAALHVNTHSFCGVNWENQHVRISGLSEA